jgi:hypothetical protein
MKNAKTKQARARAASPDEILPEYDFSRSWPNKYASRFQAGSAVVVLDQTLPRYFQALPKSMKPCAR